MGKVESLEDATGVIELTGDQVLRAVGLRLAALDGEAGVCHIILVPGEIGGDIVDRIGRCFCGGGCDRAAGNIGHINGYHIAGIGGIGQCDLDVGGICGLTVIHVVDLDGQLAGGDRPHIAEGRLTVLHRTGDGIVALGLRGGGVIAVLIVRVSYHPHIPGLVGQVCKIAQASGIRSASVLRDLLALGHGLHAGGVGIDIHIVVLGIFHPVERVVAVFIHSEVGRSSQSIGVHSLGRTAVGFLFRPGAVDGGPDDVPHLREVGVGMLSYGGAAAGQQQGARRCGKGKQKFLFPVFHFVASFLPVKQEMMPHTAASRLTTMRATAGMGPP